MHPNVVVRDSGDPRRDRGLFAIASIRKGEIVDDASDDSQILSTAEVEQLAPELRSYCYGIDDGREICPKDFRNLGPSWYMNHSCDPNVGSLPDIYRGVAMRDIEPGEEITYDYAMTDSGDYDMECFCGKPNCRGRVTGADWMRPELQERYRGYFQKNIQAKIDAIQ